MTVAIFANDTLTIHRLGVTFCAEMSELSAKELRDQLLERYPVEPEATSTAGPLREVALAEARPGDIATFEIKSLPSDRKFVCTLKKMDEDVILCGDDMTLLADKWLTANKKPSWCIRGHIGNEGGDMKDLHIWRWGGALMRQSNCRRNRRWRDSTSRPPAIRCCTTTVTSARIGADRMVRGGAPAVPMRTGRSSCMISGLNSSR